MIRFEPDSWVDAVMRPIAMAAPNGGVYSEIVAPDFRFLFVLLLVVALLVLRRSRLAGATPAFALLAFCAAAFVPWMITSGNGRYFMAVLLLAGPLSVALLSLLPVTRAMRMTVLASMIGLQLFLIYENSPWDSWGLKPWGDDPAFAVDVPADMRENPATYITLTSISYSIIAPQFHPGSHWINLTTQYADADSPDARRTRAFLAAARDMRILIPSRPGETVRDRPPAPLLAELNEILHTWGLGIDAAMPCRLVNSPGLTRMGLHRQDTLIATEAERRGFWVCPVARQPDSSGQAPKRPAPEVEAVFDKVEHTCPRMFAPGEARTSLLSVGARRFYPNSDMRLYVLQNGEVMYKYMRALNAVSLGRIPDVLSSGFRMDCNEIRGRSGLPWDREI
jgi:hypothetical protein